MARPLIQNLKLRTVTHWLVELLILAGLLWVFFILAGRALCHIALGQIAELTNTKIKTGSVDFKTDGSVLIKKLVISPHKEQSNDGAILKAERVYARFSFGSLLLLKPRLKTIDIDDFVFNALYDLDTGSWNLSALKIKPPRSASGKMPSIRLIAGKLQYSKISNGEVKVALSLPLNARFGHDEQMQNVYSFEMTTATMASGYGKSRLSGFWKPGLVTIAGGVSSVDVPGLEMAWMIDVLAAELKYNQDNTFSIKINIKDLESKGSPALDKLALVGPAFLEKSGPFVALQKFFDRYQPYGLVDVDFKASGNFNHLHESALTGTVHCKDVTFLYNKFPYTIENLAGKIDFTNNSLTLKNLKGTHGDAEIFIDSWSRDFGHERSFQVHIKSDKVALDRDLYNALSMKQKGNWSAFSPSGFAAVDYRFSRQPQTGKEEKLTIELLGAEAVYRNFPYPLDNLTGRVIFDHGNVILSNIVSRTEETVVAINGEVTSVNANEQVCDISVDANNVPLDSTLEAALSEGQRNFYNQIHPTGYADGNMKIFKQGSEPVNYTADLTFKQLSLNSQKFPSPVFDISANAVFTPDLITVKSFSGRYNDGRVSLTGQIHSDKETQQLLYNLSLDFEQVKLNDNLKNLLPETMKQIVTEMKPQGKLNFVADLNKQTVYEPTEYRITVGCLGDNSVDLPYFPCPLSNIDGNISITKDSISLLDVTAALEDSVSAEDDAPTIRLNGEIVLVDNSFDSAHLRLSAKDIFLNEQFCLVMPGHIQSLYSRLSPESRFDLDFENFNISLTEDGRKSIYFAGAVKFKNCGLKMSDTEAQLNAVMRTEGSYETDRGLSACQAAFEDGTFKILGKSFTNLKADIDYEPDLGLWSTENLIVDCYGGKSTGKFQLKQPPEGDCEYLLQVSFNDVDVRQFLSDTETKEIPEHEYTSGQMNGSLSINAQDGNKSSRIGTCRLAIDNMQVGQLSPLGRVLQVLKLTEPKDYAFDRMFVDSYIRRNELLVKKLDLAGQAVAFYGSGHMDLQTRDVDLNLIARGRRLATADPSILQSLTEGLGRAVIRMEVKGDLYDPEVTTTTLPVIRETLQILGTRPAKSNQ